MNSSREPGGVYRLKPNFTAPEATTTSPPPSTQPLQLSRTRFWVLFGLMVAIGCILLARLIWVQLKGPPPIVHADNDVIDKTLPRGTITDRRGNPLAMDYYRADVYVDPQGLKDAEGKELIETRVQALAQTLGPMLGIEPGELVSRIHKAVNEVPGTRYIHLVYGEPNLAIKINTDNKDDPNEPLDGWRNVVTALVLPITIYPEKSLAAQVVGFVNADRRGVYGLEARYDDFLRASSATFRPLPQPRFTESDPELARIIEESIYLPSPIQHDIILTLDRVDQFIAEENLRQAVREFDADGGTVIIMDPHTGAVLAMANEPSFDPNYYFESKDEPQNYMNPAIDGIYEPGSVFKLITYAAALDKGVITPDTLYEDEVRFEYYEQVIQNWDRRSHGTVTATEALVQSLNVVAAKIAIDLGKIEFYKAVNRFGFGQTTGIELPNELPGIVNSPRRSTWIPGSLATNSFGQGISVTPLQMANAVATIANGGVRHRAHIVRALIKEDKVQVIEPQAQSRAISPEAAAMLTEMMVQVVNSIPAAAIPGYRIAGKSGTAQIPRSDGTGYVDGVSNATFVGFFPADNPRFVVLAKLNRPRTSIWASQTAANLFRYVVHDLIYQHDIPPDGNQTVMTPTNDLQ